MLQYLLDTDHLTFFDQGHPRLIQRIIQCGIGTVGVSVVTMEESLRGRISALARPMNGATRIHRYSMLRHTVELFQQLPVVAFNQSCEDYLQQLVVLRLRIGKQDLKIAASALAWNLTVLTRNKSDFGLVPGLMIDNWTK